MFTTKWKLFFGLLLFLIIMILTACVNEGSIEKYTLTVNVEQATSTPTIKVYDDQEEIASQKGNPIQFNLSNGSYTIEIITDGYPTKTKEILINDDNETISLNPGKEWSLAWADEFDSLTLDSSNWTRQVLPAGTFNNEWQAYTDSSENSYIQMDTDGNNGAMVIEAKYNDQGLEMGNFTSARMITNEKVEYQYGKIAARIKVPEGQGIWPAFWMLGTNIDETGGDTSWPYCGEIDIMEKIGGSNTKEKTVHGTVHFANEANAYEYIGGSKTISEYLSADYHVYEIEWNADAIIWRLDGVEYHRQDMTDPMFDEFEAPFYILLNVAVGGNWPGYPDATTIFPQKMYIDWVRVYK
ncbi:beta-glucanase/beta-glucan synthetase [Halobacteroides halobius DSM 5150]|uniref:Beta-glucanase/beta-glucan synthetase n=1 Tax=Halobacteroides halobius (strain ATCC 35273 / DSM 5150 / MD-1) TaxID=748449 RepID=L0K5J9_HALHC|nr:glycoside hydrolase family 16 protein [Halobacteroides halobius]AGB40276.1 beta-glucanase/beta-glucan synthetase [Halobacteroides halobius DSM 5150]